MLKLQSIIRRLLIHILAQKNESGLLFESLLKSVLSRQGYGNIQSRIHATGTEIDIEATNNVTGGKIRVEAKAHEKPIDTPELRKFLLTANNDIQKKKTEYEIFWSLSGINSTAHDFFNNELTPELKDHIILKDDKEFHQILVEIGLIGNESSIENNVKDLVKKNLLSRELVFYQNQWFFVQYCSENQKPTHFFVVNNFGNPVEDLIAKGIRELKNDLRNLNLILLDTKKRVLNFMLNKESITISEIVEGIKESKVDIQSVIEELLDQQLISKGSDVHKYSLVKELEAFLKITREFLEKGNKREFMNSSYLTNSINGNQIISHIVSRFHLKPNDENKKAILRMVLVSPSALHYCLFGSTLHAQNLTSQFKNNMTDSIYGENLRTLLTELCMLLLADHNNSLVLGLQNTVGIDVNVDLKIVTLEESFLIASARQALILATAGGAIKPGEAVSAQNPQMFLRSSIIHTHFGNIPKAISLIDDALTSFEQTGEWVYEAYTNKGILLHTTGKLGDALKCYEKAVKLFPQKNEIWLNYGLLLIDINKISKAKNALKKALHSRPNDPKVMYALARIAILEKDKETCFKNLELVLNQNKRFLERIQLDKEFKQLRKSQRYFKLLKKLGLI